MDKSLRKVFEYLVHLNLTPMCGIVGYIGQKEAAPILLDGLKQLAYRGYDSAGIATIANDVLDLCRAVGKVSALEEKLLTAPLSGTIGIGHTRWATHGKPSETNSHPHRVGKIAVVHNGIVENFAELKKELEICGAVFQSETDTEVIAHLINNAFQDSHSLLEATQSAIKQIRGAYAIAAIAEDDSKHLVLVRNASPLVVGLSETETSVASDITALPDTTRQVIFLENQDVAEIGRGTIRIFQNNQEVIRERQTFQANRMETDDSTFPHILLREIFEQPRAIKETIEKTLLDEPRLKQALRETTNLHHMTIVACGTSFHAALVAKYWIESFARIAVSVELASEFRSRVPAIGQKSLVFLISQSGETADVLAAAEVAKEQGAKIIALTNVSQSSLARVADFTMQTDAGVERSVASTKCFTAQLASLYCLSLTLGEMRGILSLRDKNSLLHELSTVSGKMTRTLEQFPAVQFIAASMQNKKTLLCLGRGLEYPIALEGALKIKELSYIHAEGFAAGEMKHGPLALVEDGVPVIFSLPHNAQSEKTLNAVAEVRARGGNVILFKTEDNTPPSLQEVCLPTIHETLTPFLSVIPFQLLSYELARLHGYDVDEPRNLAKTVTVE